MIHLDGTCSAAAEALIDAAEMVAKAGRTPRVAIVEPKMMRDLLMSLGPSQFSRPCSVTDPFPGCFLQCSTGFFYVVADKAVTESVVMDPLHPDDACSIRYIWTKSA